LHAGATFRLPLICQRDNSEVLLKQTKHPGIQPQKGNFSMLKASVLDSSTTPQNAAAATAVAIELDNPLVSEPGNTASDGPGFHEITQLAHQLWIERGCPEGSPEVDWFRAEQQLGRPEQRH
jgi:hypothetical protein